MVGLVGAVDEAHRASQEFLVDRLHPGGVERAGVFDHLLADPAEPGIFRGVVGVGRPAMQHIARSVRFEKGGIGGVVRVFRFLMGIEMVEVAEELVEAMHGREVLVEIAEVILAELAGGVPHWLEELGDGWVFRLESLVFARHPDTQQSGAERALAGDKGGASGGARLLAVGIGELDAFAGNPVDVGGLEAHHAEAVGADVPVPNVVGHDRQDVRARSVTGHRGCLVLCRSR